MESIDKLISARWIIPMNTNNQVLENHSLAIKGDRIHAILPTDQAKSKYDAKESINLANHVVMPGLVNAHTHSPMNLFRGLADDLKLMDWLNNHLWPAENEIVNAESVIDGCRIAIAEMIRGGVTCFNEMYFFPNETAETCVSEGMRACIGHTIMNVPTGWANDENEYINKAKQAFNNRTKNSLISWSVAPHACYTNSDSSLLKAKELAEEFDCIMNMHVHETLDEIDINLKQYQQRPLHRLYDLGLLNEKFVAIHMVHLLKQEITLIKESGCSIVHCPESNLKLASGFAPVMQLLEEGINVAIGTDSAASNNDLDMFSDLRTASLIAKAVNEDATALPAAEALRMATINGAKAIGLDHEIGSLEVGKAADMISVNMNHLFTQPIYNPVSHLAYAVNRLQVSDVWIAGKQLLRNGEFTQLDVEQALTKAHRWAKMADKYKSKASTLAEVVV